MCSKSKNHQKFQFYIENAIRKSQVTQTMVHFIRFDRKFLVIKQQVFITETQLDAKYN